MAKQTIRLSGFRETSRALRKTDKETRGTFRDAMKKAAQPVVSTAKAKLSAYPGASVSTIGPRVTTRSVFVTQRKKKVTGLRPDFGVLQMTEVLEPALDEHTDDVVKEVEDAFDTLGKAQGF